MEHVNYINSRTDTLKRGLSSYLLNWEKCNLSFVNLTEKAFFEFLSKLRARRPRKPLLKMKEYWRKFEDVVLKETIARRDQVRIASRETDVKRASG